MNFSYFGDSLTQADIGAVLRTSPDDKNVSPHELVTYARGQGYHALELVNGSDDLLRALLSNGLPVLLETWYEREPGDGIGHYRLLVGYNDTTQQWTFFDSLDSTGLVSAEPYAGIRMSYAQMAEFWRVFNHAFVLLYPPEQAALAEAILADHGLAVDRMWVDAETRARADVAADERDLFAWFNLGSSLTRQGRTAEAAAAFDRAQQIGLPERMLWYQFTPLEAYLAEGRPQEILALTDVILEETESIEEIFYWRAQALLALGDVTGAQAAVQQSLALAPGFQPSIELSRLLENG
jgi:tetratricopeptide (TPR) repeat protein